MLRKEISQLRQNYQHDTLEEDKILLDPIKQFEKWFADATAANIYEPNAMTLATSLDNIPDARIVLLKSFNDAGFVFFTNYNSSKGQALAHNPQAAIVFLWKELERQVRIRGQVEKLDPALSEEYFRSRPFDSQCGAIASDQSSPIASRQALNAQFEKTKASYQNQSPPMPAHWGGYKLVPIEIEFWQGREGRMHDRILFFKEINNWAFKRIQP